MIWLQWRKRAARERLAWNRLEAVAVAAAAALLDRPTSPGSLEEEDDYEPGLGVARGGEVFAHSDSSTEEVTDPLRVAEVAAAATAAPPLERDGFYYVYTTRWRSFMP